MGGGGGGGNGSGSGDGGANLLAAIAASNKLVTDITSAITGLTATINGMGLGGGPQTATFAPFVQTNPNGVLSQAYNLQSAVNPNGQPFSPLSNPLNLAPQALSQAAPQSSLQVGSNETMGSSTLMDWWGPMNGAASTGGAATAMLKSLPSNYDAVVKAVAQNNQSSIAIAQQEVDQAFRSGLPWEEVQFIQFNPTGGHYSVDQQAWSNWSASNPPMPSAPGTPNPPAPIPQTPIFGGGPGSPIHTPNANVTINALSPDARGTGEALINYLRSTGMKV
jgi:hypothetical protein